MKLSTGVSQAVLSNIGQFKWLLILATLLVICCSCINSKPADSEQLNEHQVIDSFYPAIVITDDIVERASPRLGRASPRLGRASPRLGRNALSRLNHAGRYYVGDDDAIVDYALETDNYDAKRASPRLGRSA